MSNNKIESFSAGYRFLSNFWPHPICMGITYPTNEHAFQAAKTLSNHQRKEIQEATTPGKAKRLGRSVTLRSDWDDIKLDVMYRINRQKFMYDDDLGDMLLNTGNAELIEGNTWGDKFWGVCDGEGENHLGKILMRIRSELRAIKEDGVLYD